MVQQRIWKVYVDEEYFAGKEDGDSRPRTGGQDVILGNPAVKTTDVLAEADFVLLPYSWWSAVHNPKKREDMFRVAGAAAAYEKSVLVWHTGDLEPRVPFSNYVLFAPGLGQSTKTCRKLALPSFIEDPLPRFTDGKVVVRERSERPEIGFCGYGTMSIIKLAYSIYSLGSNALKSKLGNGTHSFFVPAPIIPAAYLRSRVLKTLEDSDQVVTKFIIRDRHGAGIRQRDTHYAAPTSVEYFQNILDTQYTLCIRGYGNWSYRFYETLACGRIPIFVNTDCVLPFDFSIDWKQYCVWIEREEIGQIVSMVNQFHNALSNTAFTELQLACRALWENYCSRQGFTNNFHQYLPQVSKAVAPQAVYPST